MFYYFLVGIVSVRVSGVCVPYFSILGRFMFSCVGARFCILSVVTCVFWYLRLVSSAFAYSVCVGPCRLF